MAQAALDSLQEATDFDVTRWDLDLDNLAILFLGGEGLAFLAVDVGGNFLGETMSMFAEPLVVAVDLVGVMAVCTLASVRLEVVQCPALSVVYWAQDRLDRVLLESNYPLLLRGDGLGLDNCRHGVPRKGRHCGGV